MNPGGLDAATLAVADRYLDERSRERRHVVVSLSGAHAYGFPSSDSDLDLKAIHLDPTDRVLGLDFTPSTAAEIVVRDGVELDYSSNEIAPVLAGILGGNGNYIERVLGAPALRTSPEHASLRPVVERALSRRLYRHYRGFAGGQRRELEAKRTVKRLLYVLRTALTGTHALLTGRVVADLTELIDEHGFGATRELVEAKRAGEAAALEEAMWARWGGEVERAFEVLERARASSVLPEEPRNVAEVDAWLVQTRRSL